jgi:hypothetical protein
MNNMANKPIIQQAQLTDENGVEAVTVATGGAVTVGPSTAGNIQHRVNGGLVGWFSAGVSNLGGPLSNIDSFVLSANGGATDALTLTVASGGAGYFLIVTSASSGASAVLFVTYASATIVEIADPNNIIAAGSITVTKSANSLVTKVENAMAGTLALQIQVIGARVESAVLGT